MCSATHILSNTGKRVMRLFLESVGYYSLPVGHAKDMMRLPFTKLCNDSLPISHATQKCHEQLLPSGKLYYSLAVGHRNTCNKLLFNTQDKKVCMDTYWLLVIGNCNRTTLQTWCNATHYLLVMGKGCERLSFKKCATSLTDYCHRKSNMPGLPFEKGWLSRAIGHRKILLSRDMCNATHWLLLIIKDLVRLFLKNCAMSLTVCWLQEVWWDCFQENVPCWLTYCWPERHCNETTFHENVQCHTHTVSHRKKMKRHPFSKICNVTHWLLFIRNDVMRPCRKLLTICWM